MDRRLAKTLLILFVILQTINPFFAVQQNSRNGFSASLFQQGASTVSNHWYSIYSRSNHRLQYLHRRIGSVNTDSKLIAPTTTPFVGNYEFLVKFKIGTPPREVKMVIDTGTGLTWIQCAPCYSCRPQTDPIFNPLNSTSFKPISCKSNTCNLIDGANCDRNNGCAYTAIDPDGSETEGILATENFTYNDAIIPNIAFGCAHGTSKLFDSAVDGVIGLDMSQESFLIQHKSMMHGKFSYCLPAIKREDVITRLNFGDQTVVLGDSTPIKVSRVGKGLYYLRLLDISVGTERLNVPPGSFEMDPKSGAGGTIIDSSTLLSFLTQPGYDMLVTKLKKAVQLVPASQSLNSPLSFCFKGNQEDLKGGKVPDLIFHFEGLNVTVLPSNSFALTSVNTVCLVVLPSADMSVFGGLLQQNLNVAYDVMLMRIHMAPSDCAQA